MWGIIGKLLIKGSKAAWRQADKIFRRKPKIPDSAKPGKGGTGNKGGKGARRTCDPKNPYCGQSRDKLEKSRNSYEKLRDEHKQKLAQWKRDPLSMDNKGTYRNAPTPDARQKIFEGRARALEKQIAKHESELRKINEALEVLGN